MDQEKIGKLIATLRKELNLTQSELGAKVGVGDRAVSKWERGITCPDISIINDLSKVLGITSDELLRGELNKEHRKPKFNKKLLLILPILLIIVIIAIIIHNNRSCIYTLKSTDNDYHIVGKVIFENNETTIIVSELKLKNAKYDNIPIKNYEYNVKCNNEFIIRKGYIDNPDFDIAPILVKDFIKALTINFSTDTKIEREVLVNNGLIMDIQFLGTDNNRYQETINIKLEK